MHLLHCLYHCISIWSPQLTNCSMAFVSLWTFIQRKSEVCKKMSDMGIDFRRQNLTSTDVRFWRLKLIPALKGLKLLQSQTTLTSYFLSEQLTLFEFGCQYQGLKHTTTLFKSSKQLSLFSVGCQYRGFNHTTTLFIVSIGIYRYIYHSMLTRMT